MVEKKKKLIVKTNVNQWVMSKNPKVSYYIKIPLI